MRQAIMCYNYKTFRRAVSVHGASPQSWGIIQHYNFYSLHRIRAKVLQIIVLIGMLYFQNWKEKFQDIINVEKIFPHHRG